MAKPIDILHSPFVFSLYNKCFNKSKRIKVLGHDAYSRVLQRIALFINADSILYIGKGDHINVTFKNAKAIQHEVTMSASLDNANQYDLIVLNQSTTFSEIKNIELLFDAMYNNSLIVIQAPYRNRQSISLWNSIKGYSQVTVSIDLFFIGIISKRKEQVKENFNLRWF